MNSIHHSLIAQADLLLLLADALRSPARRDTDCHLAQTTGAELDELVAAAGLPRQHAETLARSLRRLAQLRRRLSAERHSDEYHRLFEGAQLCPLNEAAYVRRDKGAILGDLCAFYRAFGWQPDGASGERPDHLVCQLEFLAMLLLMGAAARQEGNDEGAAVTGNALASFADSHLGQWLEAVCQRLSDCAQLPFYQHLAETLDQLWSTLLATHGWQIAPGYTSVMPLAEPETPYQCDACPPPAAGSTP